MNNNNKAQNNKGQVGLGNPVKYKNVHLARPLDRFDKGDFFEVATVENYRGQVRRARALRKSVLHLSLHCISRSLQCISRSLPCLIWSLH
jgi:hypothetical protein